MPRCGFAALLIAGFAAASAPAAEKLGYHEIRTDSAGRIVPWFGSGPAEAYDHVVRLVWGFWRDMRPCPNGVPYYMQHQVWKPEEDPRGLGGDQINMALSSWYLLYGYLGDPEVKLNMIFMADYWLAHGMSAPDLLWADLPYPYNTELHSGMYDGDMRAGKGFLQPDKAATFGAELVRMYKMTGDTKYLAAAVRVAKTLAARIQPGDADASPWPYRVHAATGEVHCSTGRGGTSLAAYTTNWTGALRLFDELIDLKQPGVEGNRRAHRILSDWLKRHPLQNNKWGPFFEDIPTDAWSDTEINADTMAAYLLENPEWDPAWRERARGILDWSLARFGNKEFGAYGVTPIHEQTAYMVPGNSHTARHASVELLYGEKTGDRSRREEAVRQLNWATYMVDTDGKNRYPRDDIWLTDGYGDYARHYLRAMASLPELAPGDQNHLLRTTSVIQSIVYAPDEIRYTKYDAASVETFKLGAWAPARIEGGAMEWDARSGVLAVQAKARAVVIRRK
jgi:hypothetical protein